MRTLMPIPMVIPRFQSWDLKVVNKQLLMANAVLRDLLHFYQNETDDHKYLQTKMYSAILRKLFEKMT